MVAAFPRHYDFGRILLVMQISERTKLKQMACTTLSHRISVLLAQLVRVRENFTGDTNL